MIAREPKSLRFASETYYSLVIFILVCQSDIVFVTLVINMVLLMTIYTDQNTRNWREKILMNSFDGAECYFASKI